ncbi:MAG: PP0621 family protein [Pseudomonadales bacterium]
MGFIGLLRLLAVLFCIWLIWRFVKKKTAGSGQATAQSSGSMVACQVCGTHVPEDNAIRSDDAWYCSAEHRDQGRA